MMITRLSDDITYKKVGQSYAMLTVCMCVCVCVSRITQKNCAYISIKISGSLVYGTRTGKSNFWIWKTPVGFWTMCGIYQKAVDRCGISTYK